MNEEAFDSLHHKDEQRRAFDSAAAGWKAWWETFERGAQKLGDRLVELARLEPGQRVLDVATGIGEPAMTAARCVGPSGRVMATDISTQMLAIAKERAADLGLRNLEFHELDAEQLDQIEGTFNSVLCRWGLMLFPNQATVLEGMRRRLVPGGRLAAAVWSAPAKVPMISLVVGALSQHVNFPAPLDGAPGVFSLGNVNLLERKLSEAGFSNVRSESITLTFEWRSAEEFCRFHQAIGGPMLAMINQQSPDVQANIWQSIADAAGQFAAPDGTVRMPNESICVVGER